ncbi:MAG: FAD-dependent monooxygenase [Gammaproteobacteria bacterium]|nr:FAD-dependent monooxygenase [Gammaproteobacteria bacterium]
MTSYKFAIVGCGMAGLSAGMLLAKAGHEVTIFERFEEAKSIGAGILLQPSGLMALDRLGLREAIETKGARIDALVGTTRSGRRVMDVRYADAWPGSYGIGIHRGNLFRTLYDSAVAAGVGVRCGVNIVGVQQTGAQRYACQTDRGEILSDYDAVIVANGTQSALRTCLRVQQRNIPYPWGALWAICADPERRFQNTLAQRYERASVMIGVLPSGLHPQTGVPCVSFFWSARTQDAAKWHEQGLAAWKAKVLGYWPELDGLLSAIGDVSDLTFATYGDVLMREWHDGAMLCIGDAGHGMSPQLGMGTNLALIDAIVLADCLQQTASLSEAFRCYSRQRRAHLKYNQLASRWLTPFFQSDSRIAALIRDVAFPLFNKIPFVYQQALRTVAGVKTGLMFDKPPMGFSKPVPPSSSIKLLKTPE